MKRFISIMIVLAVFAITANAQISKPFSIYLGGGVTLPNSPAYFKDAYKMGFHGSIGLGLKFLPLIELVPKLEYHTMSIDKDKFQPAGAGAEVSNLSGGTLTAVLYGADARLALGVPGAPIKPFVLAGAGFARLSTVTFKDTGTDLGRLFANKTKFYINVGAGIEYGRLFLQGRYLRIAASTPDQQIGELKADKSALVSIPITAGIKF